MIRGTTHCNGCLRYVFSMRNESYRMSHCRWIPDQSPHSRFVGYIDVGNGYWRQLLHVGDGFGHFGPQHPLSFYIGVRPNSTDVPKIEFCHQHPNIVANFKSSTSLSLTYFFEIVLLQHEVSMIQKYYSRHHLVRQPGLPGPAIFHLTEFHNLKIRFKFIGLKFTF